MTIVIDRGFTKFQFTWTSSYMFSSKTIGEVQILRKYAHIRAYQNLNLISLYMHSCTQVHFNRFLIVTTLLNMSKQNRQNYEEMDI
jgi:hypothetical protein